MEDIDSSSGLLIPFFDADTNVVYVAGKVLSTFNSKSMIYVTDEIVASENYVFN